jgi:ligand-binding sensor domain-containing protein
VVDLFVDRQDNLWFSGKYTGLQKATFTSSQFKPLDMHADTEDGNDVRGIFQDRDGYVWTGARDGTISVFDRQMHYLGNLTRSGHVVPNSTDRLGHAYCFVQDKEGNLWIGTKFGGLFRLRRQGPMNYDIRQYKKGDDPYSLCHNDIFSMCIDGHDRLWIATFGGGITKPEHLHFKTYKRMADDLHSLSNNDVQQIFFSREGTMYVCTYGGGFCAVREQGGRLFFEPYTIADGLRSDIVFTMQEDDRGNLWLSSESGLARFYPRDRRIEAIPTYFFDQRVDFNEGAAVRLDDGRLLFPARNHGPVYFNPAQMVMSRYVPRIVITRLFIGQAEVTLRHSREPSSPVHPNTSTSLCFVTTRTTSASSSRHSTSATPRTSTTAIS